jgi:hypothetical protein
MGVKEFLSGQSIQFWLLWSWCTTSIGNDVVTGTAITVNAAAVGAAAATNDASATVDAAAATYYNTADDSEPRINDGSVILPEAKTSYESLNIFFHQTSARTRWNEITQQIDIAAILIKPTSEYPCTPRKVLC